MALEFFLEFSYSAKLISAPFMSKILLTFLKNSLFIAFFGFVLKEKVDENWICQVGMWGAEFWPEK